MFSSCADKEFEHSHRMQWWLDAIGWDCQDRPADMNGEGILIAIIDTAVDIDHPDIQGKVVKRHVVDGISLQRFEHATAIAGIICATPNTSEGVLGIAESAKILSIVIADSPETSVDALVAGIEYAIEMNVNIINISAGLLEHDFRLERAIESAHASGIVIIAAAGNDYDNLPLYPARYSQVISIRAIMDSKNKLDNRDSKSIYLPGGNIVTTYSSVYEPKKYVSYTGSSMSAAIMTGMIAILMQKYPDAAPDDIMSFFSGQDLGGGFYLLQLVNEFGQTRG